MSSIRQFLESIVAKLPMALVCLDREGDVGFINPRAAEMTTAILNPDSTLRIDALYPVLAEYWDDISKALTDRRTWVKERLGYIFENRQVYATFELTPVKIRNLETFLMRIDDDSIRVKTDQLIIQSEKMLSLGGLAAGMAHEINNPLAGILQSIQVIRDRMTRDTTINRQTASNASITLEGLHTFLDDRKIIYFLDEMRVSCQRAVSIVDNMLRFSRESGPEFRLHHISDLVEQAVELAENDFSLKRRYDFRLIEIERNYDSTLPRAPCESIQIQQVFFNILKNAAQAMMTDDRRHHHHKITITTCLHDDLHRTEITDNGPGMPEAVKTRVFEPFFSTRNAANGTGLGLSVSFFIITHNHCGSLQVDSTPGTGTRFIIDLPLKK